MGRSRRERVRRRLRSGRHGTRSPERPTTPMPSGGPSRTGPTPTRPRPSPAGLPGACWGWEAIPLELAPGDARTRHRHAAGRRAGRDDRQPGARAHVHGQPAPGRRARPCGTSLEGGGRVGITFLPGKKRDGWTGPALAGSRSRPCPPPVARRGRAVPARRGLGARRLPGPGAARRHGGRRARSSSGSPIHDPRTPARSPRLPRGRGGPVERIRGGQFVAIACRGGIDRSGMTAACLYREARARLRRGDPAHAGRPEGLDHASGAAGRSCEAGRVGSPGW